MVLLCSRCDMRLLFVFFAFDCVETFYVPRPFLLRERDLYCRCLLEPELTSQGSQHIPLGIRSSNSIVPGGKSDRAYVGWCTYYAIPVQLGVSSVT